MTEDQKEITISTAEPAALGLFGLALVTIVAGSQKMGWSTGVDGMIPWVIFLGAIAQLITASAEFKRSNVFGATVFAAFGLFWLAVGWTWHMGTPSPEQLAEAQTQSKTEQIKDLLTKAVEEFEQNLDEQQKELFNKSGLRQMIEQLALTKDRKDALRQYARIERQMRQMSVRAETERDEKFLSEAAKDLNKSDRTRQLGKKFQDRNGV